MELKEKYAQEPPSAAHPVGTEMGCEQTRRGKGNGKNSVPVDKQSTPPVGAGRTHTTKGKKGEIKDGRLKMEVARVVQELKPGQLKKF